jgi:hypothetical protein
MYADISHQIDHHTSYYIDYCRRRASSTPSAFRASHTSCVYGMQLGQVVSSQFHAPEAFARVGRSTHSQQPTTLTSDVER